MAAVAIENWKEIIRDPKIECMSRDEMSALQGERLVKQVKNVYEHVEFYRKKMDELGVEPGDIKGIEDIIPSGCWRFQRRRLPVCRVLPEPPVS